jgi:hypothetical protein
MTPAAFSRDIQEFLRLLARYQVRYVLVGGEAVIYHGHVRLTGDVDVYYDRDSCNAARLHAALTEFWAGAIPGVGGAADLEVPGAIFLFGRPPHRLDLLNRIDGLEFGEAWNSRVSVDRQLGTEILPVHYIGLDELIRNKEAAGRPKDQEDLGYLQAARARRIRRHG